MISHGITRPRGATPRSVMRPMRLAGVASLPALAASGGNNRAYRHWYEGAADSLPCPRVQAGGVGDPWS